MWFTPRQRHKRCEKHFAGGDTRDLSHDNADLIRNNRLLVER